MAARRAKGARGGVGEQLELRVRTWGGARRGAGRKRAERRRCEPHRARARLARRHPVHVVMRVVAGMATLRQRKGYEAIERALRGVRGGEAFRVVHVSIQRTHLHLIVEAEDERALARGMQRFAIGAARGLNRAFGRRGTVFPQRYHATAITTPRQARSELAYVLNNWRKHGEDREAPGARLDRYASGIGFDGWDVEREFAVPRGYEPLSVEAPTRWLLTTGWRRHGRIGTGEVPGARRATRGRRRGSAERGT